MPPVPEYHYRWEWRLSADPAALWPFVSDTNRFNRDTGLPAVEQQPVAGQPLANARRRLRLRRLGVLVEWEEAPFEWVRPHRFGVVRRYSRGPVAEMRTLAEMSPAPEGGTLLVYQVWARPRNLLGHLAIPLQIGLLSRRSFGLAFQRYDQAARARRSPVDLAGQASLAPGGRERLAHARQALLGQGADPDLVERLVNLVLQADDLAVARLRPYALAEAWQKPRHAALELCLLATRAGLLDLRWDLLCPLCRGPQQRGATLGEVRSDVHCSSCNIDFTVNFDRQVELTFRPNPAIRPPFEAVYCVGGPQITPHIVAQQLLPPGGERAVTLQLEPGRYRLRTLALRGMRHVAVAGQGLTQARLAASDDPWPADELIVAPSPTLHLSNETSAEQLFILERAAWTDLAATAAEVTALQVFRDLFAREALRPGERISVGSLTVLFTDLRESTRLYRESGDAVAFGRVMRHFDVLREAVAAEDGAVVKTIGDSVMAVFRRPVSALRAVFQAQAQLDRLPGPEPLRLKAGAHAGPCVAVNLNDRLDYFGTTVNLAARLEGLAATRPGIVVSAAVRHDPEVEAWIAAGGVRVESFEAALRGFENERFELWTVTPASAAEPAVPTPG